MLFGERGKQVSHSHFKKPETELVTEQPVLVTDAATEYEKGVSVLGDAVPGGAGPSYHLNKRFVPMTRLPESAVKKARLEAEEYMREALLDPKMMPVEDDLDDD